MACFRGSDHEGHDVTFITVPASSEPCSVQPRMNCLQFHWQHLFTNHPVLRLLCKVDAGGSCDCGDVEAWSLSGCCPKHSPAEHTSSEVALPPAMASAAAVLLNTAMTYVVEVAAKSCATETITIALLNDDVTPCPAQPHPALIASVLDKNVSSFECVLHTCACYVLVLLMMTLLCPMAPVNPAAFLPCSVGLLLYQVPLGPAASPQELSREKPKKKQKKDRCAQGFCEH